MGSGETGYKGLEPPFQENSFQPLNDFVATLTNVEYVLTRASSVADPSVRKDSKCFTLEAAIKGQVRKHGYSN